MTDLEDRIRRALHDPRRELPVWPDPMRHIRRAARRQRAALAAGGGALTAVVAAAVSVPAVALRTATALPGHGGSAISRIASSSLPSWTKQLGGAVAYECGNTVCLMRPDGTGNRTLNNIYPLWDAAWSRNGRLLAFRGYWSADDGHYDLYTVGGPNRCQPTRLTRGLTPANPTWSPAGTQIAYSPAGGGIDAIGTDGTGIRHLTTPTSQYQDTAPAWSATNRLAFVRAYSRQSSLEEISTMNAAGHDVTALTHGAPGYGAPAWSPDGKLIAFVKNPSNPGPGVIEVANASGTGAHPVSPPSWRSSSPTWTLHGKVIFLAQKGARDSAYIVNPDGTGRRLLYPNLDTSQIAWGSRTALPAGC